jgi:predicted DNA-binding protein (MmcQ/YjbR family)
MGIRVTGINLKCDPDRAQVRAEYESINSGFHMNKKTRPVLINLEVSDVFQRINRSFV